MALGEISFRLDPGVDDRIVGAVLQGPRGDFDRAETAIWLVPGPAVRPRLEVRYRCR